MVMLVFIVVAGYDGINRYVGGYSGYSGYNE